MGVLSLCHLLAPGEAPGELQHCLLMAFHPVSGQARGLVSTREPLGQASVGEWDTCQDQTEELELEVT